MQHHNYSLSDLENMIPYEREIYVSLLNDFIKEENERIKEQKQKIFDKVKDLNQKVSKIDEKLKNKSFLKNAPKQVATKEKKTLIDYKIELKKLNSILNSIKN